MSLSKKLYFRSVSLAPLDLLKKMSAVRTLFPYHHLVSDERVRHVCQLYSYKNKKQFIADLDYLLMHFIPVHPADLIRAIRNGTSLPRNSFLLSFDDGFRELHENVAPILLAKGVPAIFFLNPAFLDNRELCFRNKLSLILDELMRNQENLQMIRSVCRILNLEGQGMQSVRAAILNINYNTRAKADELGACIQFSFDDYLNRVRPYLMEEQVRDMISKGFSFGAHSLDHPNYSILPLEDQLRQTWQSCKIVQDKFRLDYAAFSFPHDDYPIRQEFFDRLFQSGDQVIDVLFGIQNQKTEWNNRMVHRFNAERPEIPINQLIKGMLFYNLRKRSVTRS